MKVNDLSKAIEKELTLYAEDATEKVKSSVKEVATSIRKDISQNAPKDRGKYAKSWKTKKTAETGSSVTYTIYANKDGYRLAHLLEFGHVTRRGGRTRAFPHIKPAEERGIREIETITRNRLK